MTGGVPWIVRHRVGQCHVSMSYLEVLRWFAGDSPNSVWRMMPKEKRMQYVRWIIEEVDENRRLFYDVMGGAL